MGNGIPFTYPDRLKNGQKFHWNTSPLTEKMNTPYIQKFKENSKLPERQNKTSFKDKINAAEKKERTRHRLSPFRRYRISSSNAKAKKILRHIKGLRR